MSKTLRQFQCRDDLWARVDALAKRRGISTDDVVQAALMQLFKSKTKKEGESSVVAPAPVAAPAAAPARPAPAPAAAAPAPLGERIDPGPEVITTLELTQRLAHALPSSGSPRLRRRSLARPDPRIL